MIATGLDRLLLDETALEELRARPWGLLAHQASLTDDLVPAHLALERAGAGPRVLFAPEHGFWGVEQDMVAAHGFEAGGRRDRERDPLTGCPIVSLYGGDEASLRPEPEAFDEIELLVIDLQDVGARYYTFAATAVWAAEVALARGLEVRILDRPNPLGGEIVEGNLPEVGLESFVSAFRIPVRHGLTLGELVLLEAGRRGWDAAALGVVELSGWRRSALAQHWERPWIAPSPNMPTVTTATLYPGGCLLEATTLSEGRGTTRPFQLVGAPGVDALRLAGRLGEALETAGLHDVRIVPSYFKPQFQKHAGTVCGGVELVPGPDGVRGATRLGFELLRVWCRTAADSFGWRSEPYEFVTDRPALDLLAGSPTPRRELERVLVGEDDDLDAWLATWAADEAAFREERRSVLLYAEEAR